MSRICDRSPCDGLLGALGKWLFFSKQDGFFIRVVTIPGNTMELETHKVVEWSCVSDETVDYCPFCGTRLSEVGPMIIEKFLRPHKRRRRSTIVAES